MYKTHVLAGSRVRIPDTALIPFFFRNFFFMTTIDFIRVYSIKELLRYARNTWQGLKKTKRIVQTTQRLTADLFKEVCPAVLLEGRDRDVQ